MGWVEIPEDILHDLSLDPNPLVWPPEKQVIFVDLKKKSIASDVAKFCTYICCNVVNHVKFFYLDRQRQDRDQATLFLIKTRNCQG